MAPPLHLSIEFAISRNVFSYRIQLQNVDSDSSTKKEEKKDGNHSLRNYRDEEMIQGSSLAHGQHINLFPPNLSSEMGAFAAVGCAEMIV